MKAIILAAGRGSRMGNLTDAKPKSMTLLDGKPLLHRAVATLRGCGIDDIVVVRGYRAADIEAPGVRYRDNPAWATTNMLGSLFANPDEVSGELLVTYADIVFEPRVVEAALAAPADIAAVVDLTWRTAYEGRTLHPPCEAEKVVFEGPHRIRRLGKTNVSEAEAEGEFIGMLKLRARGAEVLSAAYGSARDSYRDAPFQTARTFATACIVDLLMAVIEDGEPVEAATIKGGWREIDTSQDLDNASRWLARSR